jgi:hypothetical protein
MNAATRAVIERLIEASIDSAFKWSATEEESAKLESAIAEARKLLEDDDWIRVEDALPVVPEGEKGAKLERELAESKAREAQFRLDAARWALFRDTPSGTFDQYKDEWRFRCNVIGGMWCKSKDDAMDYALSKLQPSGPTAKGDTNG